MSDRRGWRLVLIGTLISALGSGLTLPFLIVYLHSIRHLGLPLAGLVVAVSGVTGLVTGTLGGSVGDTVGVGRLLTGGLVLSGVATLALALVHDALMAMVVVALIGVGESVTWPALNALVAHQRSAVERPRAYALRFGVLNAGLGLGAVIAGFVVSLRHPGSFEAIYVVDGMTTLAFALIVGIGLRRSSGFRAPPVLASSDATASTSTAGYRRVLADRTFVAWLIASTLFVFFGYAMIDGAWSAWATVVVHAAPRIAGFAFGLNTGVIVLAQLGVARLTRRWRRSRVLFSVGLVWVVAWAMAGFADVHALPRWGVNALLVGSLGVFGFGETLLSPVSGAIPNDLAPDHLRVRYNALGSVSWSLGTILGPPIAGLLLASAFPPVWIIVDVLGAALAAFVGLSLARVLPAAVDRPVLDGDAASGGT